MDGRFRHRWSIRHTGCPSHISTDSLLDLGNFNFLLERGVVSVGILLLCVYFTDNDRIRRLCSPTPTSPPHMHCLPYFWLGFNWTLHQLHTGHFFQYKQDIDLTSYNQIMLNFNHFLNIFLNLYFVGCRLNFCIGVSTPGCDCAKCSVYSCPPVKLSDWQMPTVYCREQQLLFRRQKSKRTWKKSQAMFFRTKRINEDLNYILC